MTLRLNDYECPLCGQKAEIIADTDEKVTCSACKGRMVKLPPIVRCNMGAAGAYGYYDDNLETYVSTNRQRREVMRQKGVTERGATPKSGEAWF